MKNLFIGDRVTKKTMELTKIMNRLEEKARHLHKVIECLDQFVYGDTGFLADPYGTMIDVQSIIPEIEIYKNKKGSYSVRMVGGNFFGGLVSELASDDAVRDAIKVVAKVAYGAAKREAEFLQRSEDEEASLLDREGELLD